MTDFRLTGEPSQLLDIMNLFHTPMFLVLVEEDGTFRFGGINQAHTEATGLTNDMLAGKRPEDVLPPRIADTVTANYARCLTANERVASRAGAAASDLACLRSFDYEEMLELPGGERWWRTHLSAVGRYGRVVALMGHSYDVTAEKRRLEQLTDRLSRVQSSADDLRTRSRASVSHLRGPLYQIMSFSELLKPEFKPPMDRKLSFLNGIRDAAQQAMEGLDKYEQDAGGILTVDGMPSDVDFGHLCRDLAALVDPGRHLNIQFPDVMVHADAPALRWVLETAMNRLIVHVGSDIALTITPDGMRARCLRLSIDCDLLDPHGTGLTPQDRDHLIAGAQVRGMLTEFVDRCLPGGRRGMTMTFVLPGRPGGTGHDLPQAPGHPAFRTGRATC